jgi:glycosyltransferase involved in cell wall biosynthesis
LGEKDKSGRKFEGYHHLLAATMKILYDHQVFGFQRVGGISRYFFELLHNFKEENDGMEWELPILYSPNEYLLRMPELIGSVREVSVDPYSAFLGGIDFVGKGKLFSLYQRIAPAKNFHKANQEVTVKSLSLGNFDLFHPTYYDDYFLEHLKAKPFVLTVYDMIHELFPEFFLNAGNTRISLVKKKLVQKASKVIAISESTKRDLVSLFGTDPEKIEVVYLSSSLKPPAVTPDASFVHQLPNKYLLFVGERGGYKNFYFFLQALLPVLMDDESLQVVCTGREFNSVEISLLTQWGVWGRVHQLYVNDEQLAYLYQKALAFVFPSLYEGFGIPVLEAFSCGCPVLASNCSSLPEVGGKAAVYFEPKEAFSIREAITKTIYNPAFRKEMVEKGYAQLENFSWGKTARETKEVYAKIIRKGIVNVRA